MDTTDRLQKAILRIAEQIHEKNAMIAVLNLEIEKLEEKAQTLEEARLILAGEAVPVIERMPQVLSTQVFSLQEEILRSLEHPLTPAEGATVRQIADAVKRQGYPVPNEKNFYSAVYTTLQRLVSKMEVDASEVNEVRRYQRKHLEVDLFE